MEDIDLLLIIAFCTSLFKYSHYFFPDVLLENNYIHIYLRSNESLNSIVSEGIKCI